ncbi:MerR family transcriptional regulator [Streptococcus hillyeri]|uniref:MerR family transcriptional regulator n=1 Tax=Streptococcus hillyeri TaxID=2282420 RepID=A0A3L9DP61_9STRE|nr:MerR family transcriptional regulator [Streptococcus hillyeri]RLY02785.1 MerR family transcriptional regulator [Streptococcus hillyeri]
MTGISADTIRYYERIGLIPPVTRNTSGIRDFTEHEVQLLEFVRCYRNAGVGVEPLIEYIQLLNQGDQTVPARIELLSEQLEDMNQRLAELTQARDRLQYKIDNYKNGILPHEQELFDE